MPAPRKAARTAPVAALRKEVESFLDSCQSPIFIEPGDAPFAIDSSTCSLTDRPDCLLIEVWDEARNLARRVMQVVQRRPGRLTLEVLRFGGRSGTVTLADAAHPRSTATLLRSSREILREHLRRWLSRQFPGWRTVDLTSGADLEHTLSPSCPRALIATGNRQWAVLAVPPAHSGSALTHGLLWLDYLRRREAPRAVEGLVLFLPAGHESSTLLRLRHLRVETSVFRYDETGFEAPVDAADHGNLITRLEPWQQAAPEPVTDGERWARSVSLLPDVEVITAAPGVWSLRVRGLEFARLTGGVLTVGVDRKRPARSLEAVERLARELACFRRHCGPEPAHPWFIRNPEAWLESVMRRRVTLLDARLLERPVYGQVPAVAGLERGVLDLLAVDRDGRLAVIELKASEDPDLPLQALDYWMRVAHHAAMGDFTANGYFPGLPVSVRPPKLYLVAPAMEFHPTTEALLSFYEPQVEVERVGLGVEWQLSPRVVLRAGGSERPEWHPARE
ncbi:MAG: hypothetical protein HZB13_12470 [Acidobacteria bacterium]|nr:hypothetical protein [Acidobacteriota bacterium]